MKNMYKITITRHKTRIKFESRIGKLIYALGRYQKLNRVTIPINENYYLLITLDTEVKDLDNTIMEKIIPLIKKKNTILVILIQLNISSRIDWLCLAIIFSSKRLVIEDYTIYIFCLYVLENCYYKGSFFLIDIGLSSFAILLSLYEHIF